MNYYPHHIGDYAKDTRALTQAEHGAYRLLIDEAYSSENGVDADEVYAISCAHTPSEKKNTDRVLAKFFVLKDGRYYQKRIDSEVAKYQEKSAKASASAKQKWANAMRTQCERIANADETQAERRCETDAYPITNNQEPKKEKTKATPQAAFPVPDWIPKPSWEGWLAMRKAKKAPNTEHALRLAVVELEKLKRGGEDPAAVLDRSTQRGWTGLFPSKDRNSGQMFASTIPPERL